MRVSRGMGAISKPKLRAIKKFKSGGKVIEPIGSGGMPYDELMGVYSYPYPYKTKSKRKKKEPPPEWVKELPPMPEDMAAGGVIRRTRQPTKVVRKR